MQVFSPKNSGSWIGVGTTATEGGSVAVGSGGELYVTGDKANVIYKLRRRGPG